MNKQESTIGIVLQRTNYGEADRIVTLLTRDLGKVRVMAKGVRKSTSKLAGGIEPFSVSDISIVKGKGDIDILTSSRLQKHYGNIISSLERLDFAYECLKTINKITETVNDISFFQLCVHLFTGLDKLSIPLEIARVWWAVQIAEATGHGINVEQAGGGEKFKEHTKYLFDIESDFFIANQNGTFDADHIKFLRLAKGHTPALLANIKGGNEIANDLLPVLNAFVESR